MYYHAQIKLIHLHIENYWFASQLILHLLNNSPFPMKKCLLTLIASFLLPFLSNAQVIEWQNTIGGNNWDDMQSIAQTTDGGYILGGKSMSNISGDKTENCIGIGSSDYWIVKTDSLGIIQWQNTIGGSDVDYFQSLQQTTDGGYILGGSSKSNISGDKTENSLGGYDYWIVKTDSLGVIQWQNTIGGNYNDYLISLQQTTDGGYILGGYSWSNISGDKTENCYGSADYWLVKTDSLGVIQWQNTIGGNDEDYLYSLQQTTDGGYILGGGSNSNISSDKTEDRQGGFDYWIVKTNSLGVIQWQNTIGGNQDDNLYSLQQTNDGGYILGGESWSNISGDKTENCQGYADYWLVRMDYFGGIQWQNSIGGSHYDQLLTLKQTSDGGYILGGRSFSNISGDKTENSNGSKDFWLVKTNSLGVIRWQNTIGGNGDDELHSLQQTSDGGYILGGWSSSYISGDKTENCQGIHDYWLVKLTANSNSIAGMVYCDLNSDNIRNIGEPVLTNKLISELATGSFAFSEQNGKYSLVVLYPGNYSIAPDFTNYYTAVPATHSASFSGVQQTDSFNDFALQPAGVFNDLCVQITPLGPFRSGFNASYMVNYSNVGTTTLNPTVIFFP